MRDVAELLSAYCHLAVIATEEVVQLETLADFCDVLEALGSGGVEREPLESGGDCDAE